MRRESTERHGGISVETALMLVMVSIAAYAGYSTLGQTLVGFISNAKEAFGG